MQNLDRVLGAYQNSKTVLAIDNLQEPCFNGNIIKTPKSAQPLYPTIIIFRANPLRSIILIWLGITFFLWQTLTTSENGSLSQDASYHHWRRHGWLACARRLRTTRAWHCGAGSRGVALGARGTRGRGRGLQFDHGAQYVQRAMALALQCAGWTGKHGRAGGLGGMEQAARIWSA